MGFTGGASGKELTCQCRRQKGWFNPWVGKIWRRAWQPTPVFLPGESHGQRSLAGYSPRDCKELDTTERLSTAQTAENYDLTILEAGKSRAKALQGWVLQASVKETLWRPCLCLSPCGGCWPSSLFPIEHHPDLSISVYMACVHVSVSKGPPFHHNTSYAV